MRDAGTAIGIYGNPPEAWHAVLPRYAELQIGEAAHTVDTSRMTFPTRLERLAALYEDLASREFPIDATDHARLRAAAPHFATLVEELASHGIPETVQHDDLHFGNVFSKGDEPRVLDLATRASRACSPARSRCPSRFRTVALTLCWRRPLAPRLDSGQASTTSELAPALRLVAYSDR